MLTFNLNKPEYTLQYTIDQGIHTLLCYRNDTIETITCQCNYDIPIYNVMLDGKCNICKKNSTGFMCRICTKSNKDLSQFRKKSICYMKCGYHTISLDPKVKEAKKQTMLSRYGVEYASQSKIAREKLSLASTENHDIRMAKAKKTIQERYGVDHYSHTPEYKAKYKKTSQERYGVDHVLQNKDVRNKYQNTMEEKYNVANPSRHPESMNKRNKTNLKKYGNICSAQSNITQQEIKQSNQKLYGVDYYFQRPDVVNDLKEIRAINKYGKPLLDFRDEWRNEYFENGLESALILFPHIKVKTAIDNFLDPHERKCANGRSHPEQTIQNFFKQRGIEFEHSVRSIVPGNNRLEIDMINYNDKISIEFNGYYWHQIVSNRIQDDLHKAEQMRSIGYHHLAIDETDYQKLDKLYDIISPNKSPIMGRKCNIVPVSTKEERKFLDENHLDGYVSSQHCWGLVYDDELLQLMSFTHDRFGRNDGRLELLRLCSRRGFAISGGSARLFNYAINNLEFKDIVSYTNNKYFSGAVNESLGFTFETNTEPGYVWIKGNQILKRYATQKHKLKKFLGDMFDPQLTENENMIKNGWTKVYDLGHKRCVFKRS